MKNVYQYTQTISWGAVPWSVAHLGEVSPNRRWRSFPIVTGPHEILCVLIIDLYIGIIGLQLPETKRTRRCIHYNTLVRDQPDHFFSMCSIFVSMVVFIKLIIKLQMYSERKKKYLRLLKQLAAKKNKCTTYLFTQPLWQIQFMTNVDIIASPYLPYKLDEVCGHETPVFSWDVGII